MTDQIKYEADSLYFSSSPLISFKFVRSPGEQEKSWVTGTCGGDGKVHMRSAI